MVVLKVYSILSILLTLYAVAATDSDKYEVIIAGLMYVPILVYLLYGGN